jgi:hypothetical protein
MPYLVHDPFCFYFRTFCTFFIYLFYISFSSSSPILRFSSFFFHLTIFPPNDNGPYFPTPSHRDGRKIFQYIPLLFNVCIPLFSDVSYLSVSCLLSLLLYSVSLFSPLSLSSRQCSSEQHSPIILYVRNTRCCKR